MRRIMMVLLVLACGCLASGCTGTVSVGAMKWTVVSIPEDMFGWDVQIPGFTATSSFDLGKTVEVTVNGAKSLVVGMVPIF